MKCKKSKTCAKRELNFYNLPKTSYGDTIVANLIEGNLKNKIFLIIRIYLNLWLYFSL